jgi:predicted Zn-dependent protease
MLESECAAEIIGQEYNERGISAAIKKMSELKSNDQQKYHFLPHELILLCRQMIEKGKVDDSDVFFHALLDTLEEDYRINQGYGMISILNGFTDKGLKLLKETMSDFPVELMVTVYSLGSDLLRKSRSEDALEMMQFNVREYPEHHLSHFGLAKTYEQLGNKTKAIESCEKALAINAGYSAAINLLKQLKDEN